MGVIAKRRTKKIVAPYRLLTSLPTDDVLTIVQHVAAAFEPSSGLFDKGDQYFAFDRSDKRCKIAYGKFRNPTKRNPSDRAYYWVGSVTAEVADQGTTMVTVHLTSWRTSDGDLNYRKQYLRFRATLVEWVRKYDPSVRLLDEAAR